MSAFDNIFLDKKILIYGLGKSGVSAFRFLKNKSNVLLYDDYYLDIKKTYLKKNLINLKDISNSKFDIIILTHIIEHIMYTRHTGKHVKLSPAVWCIFDVYYAFWKRYFDLLLTKLKPQDF